MLYNNPLKQKYVYCTLLGPLQAVMNLVVDINFNEFAVTWDPPSSLDLTNVDPDIIYCVQVINTTCGTRSVLFSDCTVLQTTLSLTGYSQHYTYEIDITPRSNVEGAMNGSPRMIQGSHAWRV